MLKTGMHHHKQMNLWMMIQMMTQMMRCLVTTIVIVSAFDFL